MLLYKPESKSKKSTGKEDEKYYQRKQGEGIKDPIEEEDYYERGDNEGKRGRYRHKRGQQPKVVYKPKDQSKKS